MEPARGRLVTARDATTKIATTEAGSLTRASAIELDKEVLKARIRPMTLELVQEELGVWLALLEATCAEISAKEIAGLQSTDDGQARFSEQAVLLRGQRGRLIERVNIVIAALEKKGGDGTRLMARSVTIPAILEIRNATTSVARAWSSSRPMAIPPSGLLSQAVKLVIAAFTPVMGGVATTELT